MNVYLLLFITFGYFPYMARQIQDVVNPFLFLRLAKPLACLLLLYDAMLYFGWSLRGDGADFLLLLSEYLLICLFAALPLRFEKRLWRILQGAAKAAALAGLPLALVGLVVFAFISQDYEVAAKYITRSGNAVYETRRYSVGSATSNTAHRLETYRLYRLPVEHRVAVDRFTDAEFEPNGLSITIGRCADANACIFYRNWYGAGLVKKMR